MTINKDTFINTMLERCGFENVFSHHPDRYPEINNDDIIKANPDVIFLSSEPYPFLRKKSVLNPVSNPYAFVDGECFSWFGLRSLRFLEKLKAR